MNSENIPLQKDELRESWVDLYYQACSPEKEKENNEIHASGLYTPLNIEKLLNDAQRESNSNSREASARGSPKGLSSPAPELALSSHSSHSSNSQILFIN
ncbi:hypothetical protein MAR_015079 [Mya arenaria]|uniref:Uncharacterized protein n=1 Tax=Mya arenaria TaxID=6604 RepID=A0ABY7FGC3_MYAAR|nr:hypothetical protein MAR_015079 [Mya arenaria]